MEVALASAVQLRQTVRRGSADGGLRAPRSDTEPSVSPQNNRPAQARVLLLCGAALGDASTWHLHKTKSSKIAITEIPRVIPHRKAFP